MDVGKSFSFVFKDQEWVKKLAIGSAIALLSFLTVGLAAIPLAGWQIEVSRRVIRGAQPTLPDWQDFGALIRDGLKSVVGALIWALPMIILFGCISVVGAALSDQSSDDFAGAVISLLALCIALPYSLLLALLFPALLGQLADHGDLRQAVNPANAFRLVRANPSGYLIALLVTAFVAPIIQSVGAVACVVGILPAVAYTAALSGHLYGQAYRDAQATVAVNPAPAA